MTENIASKLKKLTQEYVSLWQEKSGLPPASRDLYGVPSTCITRTGDEAVYWLPQPFIGTHKLEKVEKAMGITIRPELHDYFSTQFAGDMQVCFRNINFSLIQIWSEEDFIRLQENIIGHLVTQKRLKLTPTLFIGTTDSEKDIISVCNVSGEVILETFGQKKKEVLAESLSIFLSELTPIFDE
ncbi:SecY-interacting protein [Proteus hauseri]|uniref:SecY-interacting protein n=1 Tax=Proteus hauseri TaxID=183417 RepID=UPI001009513C|nr:SecY-interacting protein [Proteus hauseri]QAV22499.1 SecY-interacting protein [Proteus hauseri]